MSAYDDYKRQQLQDHLRGAVLGDPDDELMAAKSDVAYKDSSHPRHKDAVARARRAYDTAYPGIEE